MSNTLKAHFGCRGSKAKYSEGDEGMVDNMPELPNTARNKQ
jgi:hypothetical protein